MRDENGNFLKGDQMPIATITNENEAEWLLTKDLNVFENIVMRRVKVNLKQNQFDALVSHAYNTGGSDTLFKLINKKAPIKEIKTWWINKYITANGVKLKGLIERRKLEFNLFAK